MIIVSRATGERIYSDELSENTRQEMAFAVFKAFCGLHPEAVQEAVEEYERSRNEQTA